MSKVIEFTFYLIILYLVVINYRGFAQVISSLASAYTSGVRSLQGR